MCDGKGRFMKKKRNILLLCMLGFLLVAAPVLVSSVKPVSVQAAVKNGWATDSAGNKYYYKNGKKLKGAIKLSNGDKYYFHKTTGKMLKNYMGSYVVKGKKHYLYYQSNGKAMKSKWLNYKSKKYYFNRYGFSAIGFGKLGKKQYYFNEDSTLYTGWLTKAGQKYYFDPKKNGAALMGLVSYSNNVKRYFSYKDGHMYQGWITYSAGKKRYFSYKNGNMLRGWAKNTLSQYRYFDKDTAFMVRGWLTVSGNKYYMDPSTGVRQSGAMTIDGNSYYFNPKSSDAMLRGWRTSGSKRYYYNRNGVMQKNTTLTIDGVRWTFDKYGVGQKAKDQYVVEGNRVKVVENGRNYYLQKEFIQHPGVADGTLSDEELLAALVYCEAGDQGSVGMEAVALTIYNRTVSNDTYYPDSLRYVIYQQSQYSPVFVKRNSSDPGSALYMRLKNPHGEGYTQCMQAVQRAKKTMLAYKSNKTARKVSGFPTNGKKDFDYLFFMTKGAFNSLGLNWSQCGAVTYKDHVFFSKWVQ